MPVDLREIASIAGMSGLFRIISPTRNGVVVETLSDTPVRSVAQAKHRLSLLNEISIYTNDPEVTAPLADLFDSIHQLHGQNLPVNAKSSNPELLGFMETILPDYDRDRVYVSDIKKIVTWFGIVSKFLPFEAAPKKGKAAAAEEEAEPKAEKKTKAKTEKTAETEKPAKTKKAETAEKPAKKTKETDADEKPKAAAKKTKKSAE